MNQIVFILYMLTADGQRHEINQFETLKACDERIYDIQQEEAAKPFIGQHTYECVESDLPK